MRTRPPRFLVAVAAVALVLTACTQGRPTEPEETSAEPITLTYLNYSAHGGHEKHLADIADAFTQENPGIRVSIQTVPRAGYATTLQAALDAGTASDVFEVDYESFAGYARSGALTELRGVNPAAYQPSLLAAFQHDGRQYGLPESFNTGVLYYNADLFAAHGVPLPAGDWTWAEERAAAEQLTDPDAGVWGDYQPVSFEEFTTVLAQAGGSFLSEDGTRATFNSPAGLRAATWLVGKPGAVMPAEGTGGSDEGGRLFAEGKLAMYHGDTGMFGTFAEVPFAWDIVVQPGEVTKASAVVTQAAVVNAKTEQVEAAQRWVQYLGGSPGMVTTRLHASWDVAPIADPVFIEPYLARTKPGNRQAVFDALDHGVLPPVVTAQQQMRDIITGELSAAAAGDKPVEQALADVEAAVNALIQ